MPRRDSSQLLGALVLTLASLAPPAAGAGAQDYRLGPVTFEGAARDRLVVGGGIASPLFSPGDSTAAAAALEYRFGDKLLVFGPSLAVLASSDLQFYAGAGIYTDIVLGPLVITPEVQAGYYSEGDGTDLGGPFAFHSLIELMWAAPAGARFGVRLSHLSNAGLYEDNPGTETILAIASFPLF